MPRAVERRAALHKRIPLDDLPRSDGPPDP
jgi:hypothetical protein